MGFLTKCAIYIDKTSFNKQYLPDDPPQKYCEFTRFKVSRRKYLRGRKVHNGHTCQLTVTQIHNIYSYKARWPELIPRSRSRFDSALGSYEVSVRNTPTLPRFVVILMFVVIYLPHVTSGTVWVTSWNRMSTGGQLVKCFSRTNSLPSSIISSQPSSMSNWWVVSTLMSSVVLIVMFCKKRKEGI